MALNPTIAAVTDRIIERSKPTRRRYLDLMRTVVSRREAERRRDLALSTLAPCRSLRRSQ
jgi:hypothetical protein